MKKFYTIILLFVVILTVSACGCRMQAPESTTPSGEQTAAIIKPKLEENTVGAMQWAAFQQAIALNNDASPEEIANALVADAANWFSGMVTELEGDTEYFAGFDNHRITGYKSGAVYMPMIGSIPFVGYVFELQPGADRAAFIKTLTDTCNPAWNVCVKAEQTVAGAIGDKVLFLMCPKNMEQF